jgi:putative transcriptional regulator
VRLAVVADGWQDVKITSDCVVLTCAIAGAGTDLVDRQQIGRESVKAFGGFEETSLTGQILIAMPAMTDPRFSQSVIFLCAHTPDGAMGIVLNQPLNKPRFAELLGQLGVEPVPPAREIRLTRGGPVEDNRGFVLHSADWMTEGSLEVDNAYVLTANMGILEAIARGGGPKNGFLALGYAGWGPGQLDAEILQNAWLNAPADPQIVFDDAHRTKWQRALAKLGIDPAMLSGTAGRA